MVQTLGYLSDCVEVLTSIICKRIIGINNGSLLSNGAEPYPECGIKSATSILFYFILYLSFDDRVL